MCSQGEKARHNYHKGPVPHVKRKRIPHYITISFTLIRECRPLGINGTVPYPFPLTFWWGRKKLISHIIKSKHLWCWFAHKKWCRNDTKISHPFSLTNNIVNDTTFPCNRSGKILIYFTSEIGTYGVIQFFNT
jgi:hypothetical protein